MKTVTTYTDISLCGQDVNYVELIDAGNDGATKLRVRIRSNAYKFQCYAFVERWDGAQWRELATVAYGSMVTQDGLAYCKNVHAHAFEADRLRLLQLAGLILDSQDREPVCDDELDPEHPYNARVRRVS